MRELRTQLRGNVQDYFRKWDRVDIYKGYLELLKVGFGISRSNVNCVIVRLQLGTNDLPIDKITV